MLLINCLKVNLKLHIEEQYFKEEGYIEVELTRSSSPGADLGFSKRWGGGGGGTTSAVISCSFLGESRGMLPQNILKIGVS